MWIGLGGKQDEEGEKEWEESITFQVKKGL